jgi:hypothetical protein
MAGIKYLVNRLKYLSSFGPRKRKSITQDRTHTKSKQLLLNQNNGLGSQPPSIATKPSRTEYYNKRQPEKDVLLLHMYVKKPDILLNFSKNIK